MHLKNIAVFLCISSSLFSQTVGNTIYLEEANSKYFTLNPISGRETYLLDNCGYIYNEWKSAYSPGLTAHVDANGNLYRSGKILSDKFAFGGVGGIIEKFSWAGELIWAYELHSDIHHLHHDFELLENGNLLVIAWEFINNEKLSTLGRVTTDESVGLYSEVIFEINPSNDFDIIWEWHAIDHTVQDLLPELQNFGSIADNPQRFNINLKNQDPSISVDWLHFNAIDYNPELDQILLCCNAIDEIIIIDHSTSISQASSSVGGNGMQGGDLLYRWGNPQNYTNNELHERLLFKQHDAQWIVQNNLTLDNIIVFNNGLRTDQGTNYSTIDEIQLTYQGDYNYSYTGNEANQKEDVLNTYNSNATEDFYSKRMSGVTKLDNGHVVICESDRGRIFELNTEEETVWEYINPVGFEIMEQGTQPIANTLFNAQIISDDFFNSSLELETDFERIEINPLNNCEIVSAITDFSEVDDRPEIVLEGTSLYVSWNENLDIDIFDISGRKTPSVSNSKNRHYINTDNLDCGIYFLVMHSKSNVFCEQIILCQ